MIGMNAPSLPPVELSDSAMRLASTLLQIAVDPNATSARLTELNTATQGLRDAITQHDAAKTRPMPLRPHLPIFSNANRTWPADLRR